MASFVCPSLVRLRQLIAGKVTDAELTELSAHLDRCATCRSTLDQLLALSGVWPVPAAAAEPVVPGPALAKILSRLQQSPNPSAVRSGPVQVREEDLLEKTSESSLYPNRPSPFWNRWTNRATWAGWTSTK